ncbi:MAG: trypsin-like serine protease [Candidatus Lernaella stagnicola]|nr:trypsin-like serine protease [Candidatus Lernaella stagnicola]
MKTRILFLVVLVFAFALTACDSTEPRATDDADGLNQSVNPIYNGFPPDAPEHDAVVSLHKFDPKKSVVYVGPFCSGTLIASDVVLTAAHCLDIATGPKSKFKTMAAKNLLIYVGDEPAVDILDHLYVVTETVIYPGYDRVALRNDLALIKLATAISEPVAPVPHLPAALEFTPADIGALINIAGFGETETGSSGVKMQIDVPLASLGCNVTGCPDAGDAATQIAYQQIIGGPCFGDSGGPAFAYRAGEPYVGGITSYGDSYCTYYGVSTRVDAFQGWIDPFVSGPTPPDCSADDWCNPECETGADPDCVTPPPGDCGNGVCDEGESCDGRYDTLSCPADCPGLSTGKPKGRYCYVGDTCEGRGCP